MIGSYTERPLSRGKNSPGAIQSHHKRVFNITKVQDGMGRVLKNKMWDDDGDGDDNDNEDG